MERRNDATVTNGHKTSSRKEISKRGFNIIKERCKTGKPKDLLSGILYEMDYLNSLSGKVGNEPTEKPGYQNYVVV